MQPRAELYQKMYKEIQFPWAEKSQSSILPEAYLRYEADIVDSNPTRCCVNKSILGHDPAQRQGRSAG